MSIEPLQKQCNKIFPLQEFVPIMLKLNNILANTHFSVNADTIQYWEGYEK